jgi:hypothetical protein
MIIHCKYNIVFVQFLLCFPIRFFYNKACNWSIGFLQIVNISKLYHILGSNHSTFYVWSFQVSFPYNILVLKMRTLLFTKYMWKTITFHCLPSSRCWCWLLNKSTNSMNFTKSTSSKGEGEVCLLLNNVMMWDKKKDCKSNHSIFKM